MNSEPLPREFFARDATIVGPELLGQILVVGDCSGKIVEVEAYRGEDDAASHAYRGPTPRTKVMFGPAGHFYIYFTYGMHWCANVVCGAEGQAGALLIRAVEPLAGLDAMWERRSKAKRETDLCSGPAKLCAAFGIDDRLGGADLCAAGSGVTIVAGESVESDDIAVTTRIGISKAQELPWRYVIASNLHLSRRVSS